MSEELQNESVETPDVEPVVEQPADRPEYIPEKFWDPDDSSTNLEALGRSYTELESFVGKKRDEIREDVITQYQTELNENRPESSNDYVIQFPDDHALHPVQDQIDTENDPLLSMWRETAHRAGLSNDEFSKGIETWVAASTANVQSRDDVSESIGENGGARIEAVEMWAARNLGESEYEALTGMVTSSDSFLALEKLMNTGKSANGRTSYSHESVVTKPTRDELNSAMNDPRYWDPGRRDMTYVKQVENMSKRLAG
jgi:hypothetical protein|tara:strand:- start:9442 stop:10212 length:771 start_codon:yes stop_codon:yes gene_type:complete